MEEFKLQIITAIVSIIVTMITTLIIKPIADKHLHRFKLKNDYEDEQRRLIKKALAKYKVHFLKSCESLNYRLWNFLDAYTEEKHIVEGRFDNQNDYYLHSFVYRIASVLAWIQIIEKELIYLDTTTSTKEDLNLIKYFRLLEQVFCDYKLEEENGITEKVNKQDHFLRNSFEEMSQAIITTNEVLSFSEYQNELKKFLPALTPMYKFIDGMNPEENRLRWHKLQIVHLLILSILNSYGYDFQYTEKSKIREISSKVEKYPLLRSFEKLILRTKLESEEELNTVVKTVKKNTAHNPVPRNNN